jgi:D-galactarolactone cycloisomerase
MTSATLSLASVLPPVAYCRELKPYVQDPVVEFDMTPHPIRENLCTTIFEQKDGYIDVPQGPGLGVEVNEKVLQKYCIQHMSLK